MRKLMVLGANDAVVPLIRAGRALGFTTYAVSIPGAYPGFAEADYAVHADITSEREVFEAAVRIGADGIATCCMDVGLRALGSACERLHLAGPSEGAARLSTNKYEMKQAFLRCGVRTPASQMVDSPEALQKVLQGLSYPVMLKAVDQMGSRGIFRCGTREEVIERYPACMAASKAPYCLVETYVSGPSFGVEGMVKDGRIVFFLPNGTTVYDGYTATPVGHYYPAPELEAVRKDLEEQVPRIVEALGIRTSPFNCDFILHDGRPYCIEATARAGANGLPELTGGCFGVNYYEQIVRLAMGEPLSAALGAYKSGKACLTYMLHSGRSGILTGLAGRPLPEGAEVSMHASVGDEVRAYTNGRDYLGSVLITGDTLETCRKRLCGTLDAIGAEVDGQRI